MQRIRLTTWLQQLTCFSLLLLTFACTSTQTVVEESSAKDTKDGRNVIVVQAQTQTVEAEKIVLTPDPFSSLITLETRFGTMKIELFFDAQEHRTNFLKHIKEGYYTDQAFHRVIRNFMAQGGDPNSKNARPGQRLGSGGPNYKIDAEISDNYFHIKGALAAARQPDETNPEKKSSGSQFYIVHGSNVSDEQLDKIERKYNMIYTPLHRKLYKHFGGSPQLDNEYTVFGRVYEGLEIIDSIATQTTDAYDRPKEDIKMKFSIIKE